MSPKQRRVSTSTATAVEMKQVEAAEGGPRRRHGDGENAMRWRWRQRGEPRLCAGKRAGRQADRGEGVQKDKARGENVAGFKGCRLAWPRRSHEV